MGTGELQEKLDCSVRAYSVAACVSYTVAHELYRRFGRLDRHSTPTHITARLIFHTFPMAEFKWHLSLTVANFARSHPTGRYICHVRKHAIAICDGIVYDWINSSRKKVISAYKLCD